MNKSLAIFITREISSFALLIGEQRLLTREILLFAFRLTDIGSARLRQNNNTDKLVSGFSHTFSPL